MSTVGIIAEFNPLHKGHEYLINEAKKMGNVVCAMSGNFVQRGDLALYPKQIRASAALSCGCDLVAELPTPWAMSTAQNFALGGVFILNALGCDTIMFGSECGEIEPLRKIADILESEEFKTYLSAELKKGITFAAARENAVKKCEGEYNILKGANNNLAIEYIIAAKKINRKLDFKTVPRIGAAHDSLKEDTFVSATYLREKIKSGDLSDVEKYIPKKLLKLYKSTPYADFSGKDTAILSVLRSKDESFFKTLPDISEGLDNKLFSSVRLACSLEELYNSLKVKRYTLARIRRLLLSAFLCIDNRFFMKAPPYIRVSGFNKTGEKILKAAAKGSSAPIVVKPSQIKSLGDDAQRLLSIEAGATDIYNLFLSTPKGCGDEYTSKIIKTE